MNSQMKMQEKVDVTFITRHAFDRARQRLQWGKVTLQRMANKAFADGLCHHHATGLLRKYLDKLWLEQKKADNVRIYGQHIFLFAGHTLLTVWQVPSEFRKVSDKLLVRHRTALLAA